MRIQSIVSLSVLMTSLIKGVWSDCVQVSSCACQDTDTYIDLSPVSQSGSPRFRDQPDQIRSGFLFSWNPCTAFDELSDCKSVAACQVTSDMSSSFPLGTQDSAKFITDRTGAISLQYKATDTSGKTRTTVVSLVCDPQTPSGTLSVFGETSSLTYAMTLTSSHCCPKSGHMRVSSNTLSPGSILVITFFAVLFVYVVSGIAFQAFVHKESGKGLIPNYPFWSALPSLVKDGVKFTVTCGKGSPSYDKI